MGEGDPARPSHRIRGKGLEQDPVIGLGRPAELVGIIAAQELIPQQADRKGPLQSGVNQQTAGRLGAEGRIESPLQRKVGPIVLER